MLRDRGVGCIHIQSQPEVGEYFRRGFDPSSYEVDLGHVPDTGRLVDLLTRDRVDRVVAGTESGVILADTLNHLLGLPANTYRTRVARRNKALMMQLVSEAGLATPVSRVFDLPRDAVDWFTASGLPEVVVKPLDSAGTDNVRFCADADAVASACRTVLSSPNLYGTPNRRVLVQERVHGVEYYVNTVSHDGRHRVAEMWRYAKRPGPGNAPVYDYEEPVDPTRREAIEIRTFVFGVLDALGIRSAAAHTEVILTPSGPVLVESGARMAGGTLPHVVEKTLGVSQAGLFADALVDPTSLDRFADRRSRGPGAVRSVWFINRVAGQMRSTSWQEAVQALPTAVAVAASADPGTWLTPTVDLFTSPGYVYLAAATVQEIERDYQRLRRMEQHGLYTC